MSVLFIKLGKGVRLVIFILYMIIIFSFRSNLYLDIQFKDQGETFQMGVGWSCSLTSDIENIYFSISEVKK